MSRSIRNIIIVICAIVVAAGLTASYFAGKSSQRPLTCKGLKVVIADSTSNSFVSRDDVRKLLDKEYGQYLDMPLDSLDLDMMEKVLEARSAINNTEAFVTKDGMLNITVTQRRPAVRFQGPEWGYYADAEGRAFPLQKSYASYVPVVDGHIPPMTDTLRIAKTTALVNFLESSSLWKDKIVQITIGSKGDIILIPREGKEKFIIGQLSDIEEKVRKMEMYYTHITPEKGSGHYRTVDLRYEGQIVCR